MAHATVVTPSGIHHLRINEGTRCFGTFTKWDKNSNIPNREQKYLLHCWDLQHPEGPQKCRRKHRTVREAVSCSGVSKPVMELSHPPRRGPHRPTGEIQSALYRKRHTPQRRPVPIAPKPSGHVYNFKPSTKPTATVQVHPPPREEPCPVHHFYQPGPEAINLFKVEPKAEPQDQINPASLTPETVRVLDGVKDEMEKHIGDMRKMVESNNQLVNLCLFQDDRFREQKRMTMMERMMNIDLIEKLRKAGHEMPSHRSPSPVAAAARQDRVRNLGILQDQPFFGREQPQSKEPSPVVAAREDPAILQIQPAIPTPPSTPSSLPSLVTVSNHEDSDSDCVITSYTPPRRRAQVKKEPIDPINQLAAGAENLLL